MDHDDRQLCLCTALHTSCNPKTCDEAAARKAAKLVIPPASFSSASPGDAVVETTIECLRESSNRGCWTCSILYYALKDKEYCAQYISNSIRVSVWYGNGHLKVSLLGPEFGPTNGTIFLDPSQYIPCTAFPGLTIHKHTASVESFKRLEEWIQVCEKRHQCIKFNGSRLPRRVLDVGLKVTESKKSRPLRVYESEGQSDPYIALSHCWGSSPVIKSTKANIHHRRDFIKWEDLSKTFQDAVTITRRLGIRYLWIDSLCIIQDDLEDWKMQSSQMLSIYHGAYLTIAADHAENGQGGCFAYSANKPFRVELISLPERFHNFAKAFIHWDADYGLHPTHQNFTDTSFIKSPLSSLAARGWTLQERLLSRRTIHYTSWELVWECQQDRQCQCGRLSTLKARTIMQNFHHSFHSKFRNQTKDLILLWMDIASDYSRRSLTYEKDQLVAINGLAKYFQENGMQGYIAGNWTASINPMLLWFVDPSVGPNIRRSDEYIVPSWSWASSKSTLRFFGRFDVFEQNRYVARICSATPLAAAENASGQLIGGELCVIGRTIMLRLGHIPEEEQSSTLLNWYLVCERSSTICYAYPDYRSEFETMFNRGEHVTGLLWSVMYDPALALKDIQSPVSSYILILKHDPQHPNHYRRVGIAILMWSRREKLSRSTIEINKKLPVIGRAKYWFKDAKLSKLTII
ncbi:hypothetical protein EG329_012444 [Mollisiaceae sp. DMI_Dod_QoI]|nr:hypothetical protein EG329_012444 [Helotiales sp. DMI_Dod_QoI]